MILTETAVPLGIGKTLALVTDTHAEPPDEVLALLRSIKPDFICMAGDIFERSREKDAQEYAGCQRLLMWADDVVRRLFPHDRPARTDANALRLLRESVGIAPVFLSQGNHDGPVSEHFRQEIRKTGAILLHNSTVLRDGILFGGLGEKPDVKWLRSFCARPEVKILLCHRPEYYPRYLRGRDISLILSGHAHGGQLRVAGRGVFAPGQGLFPRYTRGVYDGRLAVSAGCANTASVPRWGNPTEVVLLHI